MPSLMAKALEHPLAPQAPIRAQSTAKRPHKHSAEVVIQQHSPLVNNIVAEEAAIQVLPVLAVPKGA